MKKHFGFLLAGLIFALDRLSKYLIVEVYDLPNKGPFEYLPFFDLTMVWNRGISLGLFQMEGDEGRYILIALTSAVTAAVIYWLLKAEDKLLKFGLGLVLGGAVGNIWDRFEYGAVADFFHFYIEDVYSFYVFNVADAAITIGVVILLWDALLLPQKKNK